MKHHLNEEHLLPMEPNSQLFLTSSCRDRNLENISCSISSSIWFATACVIFKLNGHNFPIQNTKLNLEEILRILLASLVQCRKFSYFMVFTKGTTS